MEAVTGFDQARSIGDSRMDAALLSSRAMKFPEVPSTTGQPPELDRRDWIAGLEHGLSVLDCFDEAHSRMTAAQVGERCGMTRTAARRYLLTLQYLGYVATDGKLYWLTPRVLRLAQRYLESSRLARIAQPYLQRVTQGTQEISYIAVMDGDDVVVIARNGPNRVMNTGFVLGARVPAQVTAVGLVLLAERSKEEIDAWLDKEPLRAYTMHSIVEPGEMRHVLQLIRKHGYAVSEQQLELNYRGIAVPVRDRKGTALAALSVTLPMGQVRGFETKDEARDRVLKVMRETAFAMRDLI
jgi:IclR family pca regulon transcriptional regulator